MIVKRNLILGAFFAVAIGILLLFVRSSNLESRKAITSFEDCVSLGLPILESSPRQCVTSDGKIFIEDIGNVNEKNDLIRVRVPQSNDIIQSPLEISGEARGMWYFEASFPVKLLDSAGNTIAESHAEAQSEWTTENFVPFTAKIEFEAKGERGTLVFEKDNPSGLSEHADEIRIPVRFK